MAEQDGRKGSSGAWVGTAALKQSLGCPHPSRGTGNLGWDSLEQTTGAEHSQELSSFPSKSLGPPQVAIDVSFSQSTPGTLMKQESKEQNTF